METVTLENAVPLAIKIMIKREKYFLINVIFSSDNIKNDTYYYYSHHHTYNSDNLLHVNNTIVLYMSKIIILRTIAVAMVRTSTHMAMEVPLMLAAVSSRT